LQDPEFFVGSSIVLDIFRIDLFNLSHVGQETIPMEVGRSFSRPGTLSSIVDWSSSVA
jgi:hypothetical protein